MRLVDIGNAPEAAIDDDAPVTFTLTAEDARLLYWALTHTAVDLERKFDASQGVVMLRENLRIQLLEQGNPHLKTTVEQTYRRMLLEMLRGKSSG